MLGVLAVGVYFFAKDFLIEKAADAVTVELEKNGQLDDVRNYIDQIPEVKGMLESSANADTSTLPFTTKNEAIETVVKKVGISELYSLQSRYEKGMSESEQLQVLQELEQKLTAEEAEALKYVIYQELYR